MSTRLQSRLWLPHRTLSYVKTVTGGSQSRLGHPITDPGVVLKEVRSTVDIPRSPKQVTKGDKIPIWELVWTRFYGFHGREDRLHGCVKPQGCWREIQVISSGVFGGFRTTRRLMSKDYFLNWVLRGVPPLSIPSKTPYLPSLRLENAREEYLRSRSTSCVILQVVVLRDDSDVRSQNTPQSNTFPSATLVTPEGVPKPLTLTFGYVPETPRQSGREL